MRELVMPRDLREKLHESMMAAHRAMLAVISENPDVRQQALLDTFKDALEAAWRKHGLDKQQTWSQGQLKELAEQIARLSTQDVYEVTERVETEDELVIRLTFVGDDNTASIGEA